MSHSPLRTDKTCLNCGFQVEDRFCSHCGQENLPTRESVGHLIGHFLSDFTHYDSKFFTSLRDLIFKPGFLTAEYNLGKRVSYLNPIRMYIFISAIFFIILFGGSEHAPPPPAEAHPAGTLAFSQHLADSLRSVARESSGNGLADSMRHSIYVNLAIRLDTPLAVKDTGNNNSITIAMQSGWVSYLGLVENKYHDIQEYNSSQSAAPTNKRDGALNQFITRRMIRIRMEHHGRGTIVITQNIGEDIPKLLFLLLPLFALFVRLFYSGKKFYYTQHIIFSLHFHCFVFIILAMVLLLNHIPLPPHFWDTRKYLLAAIALAPMLLIYVYLALALTRVYHQPLWLSFIKAASLGLMYVLVLILGNVGIGIYSFLTA